MIALLAIAILCSATAQEDGPSRADVVQLLEARDASLERMHIELETNVGGLRPRESRGWWCKNGPIESCELLNGPDAAEGDWAPQEQQRAVWDGATCEYYRKQFTDDGSPPTLLVSEKREGPLAGVLPLEYGVRANVQASWSEALGKGFLRYVEDETVGGRRCSKFLWDAAYDQQEGHRAPWLVWLDLTETWLVWRCISYGTRDSLRNVLEPNVEPAVVEQFGGKEFIPFIEKTIVEAQRVDGIWLAVKGSLRLPANPALGGRTDTFVLRINQEMPANWDRITIEPETMVHDSIRDEWYVASPTGEYMTSREVKFEKQLVESAAEMGSIPSERPVSPQPFYEATCGPTSLYFILRLRQKRVALEDLLKDFEEQEQRVSLQELCDVAIRHGVDIEPMHYPGETLPDTSGHFIAHLDGYLGHPSEPDALGHFAVGRVVGDRVTLVFPAGRTVTLSVGDFQELWSGYAAVDSSSAGRSGMVPGKISLKTVLMISGIGLLLIGMILVMRGRRIAKSVRQRG